MSVKERLKEFIKKELKLPVREFEKRVGMSNGYVNSISKGIGNDYLKQIKTMYPQLDIAWLLTGKGDSEKEADEIDDKSILQQKLTKIRDDVFYGNIAELARAMGITHAAASRYFEKDSAPSYGTMRSLFQNSKINPNWFFDLSEELEKESNIIPLYDEVVTIGGIQSVAETRPIYQSSSHEMIDAGDWFPNATAAIRHYEDSMVEYPSGSILVLREVHDKSLIIWGKNYVIETEYARITKKLQKGEHGGVVAYSTNRERYEDGRVIHEPIKIDVDQIKRLFIVLGCISKQYSSGAIEIINATEMKQTNI